MLTEICAIYIQSGTFSTTWSKKSCFKMFAGFESSAQTLEAKQNKISKIETRFSRSLYLVTVETVIVSNLQHRRRSRVMDFNLKTIAQTKYKKQSKKHLKSAAGFYRTRQLYTDRIRYRTTNSSHESRQKRHPSVSWALQRGSSEMASSPGPWLQLTGSQTTRRSASTSLHSQLSIADCAAGGRR